MKKTTLNKIELTNLEDYSEIGNSRIGGQPDLPIEMDYPTTEDGFLEFIMQINLNEVEIEGLPNSGILSLFNGNLDKREAKGFYFNESTNLTPKEIPINTKFAGVVDFHEHTSHKISIIKKEVISMDVELSSDEENDSRLDSYHNCSYVLGAGLIDKSELYLRTNGFDLIPYSVRLTLNKQVSYSGRNANIQYTNIQDLINCPITDYYENIRFPLKATRKEWIDQLKAFENQKEIHLERFAEYVCLISLESIHKVGMIWGDLHKLEMYGLESDFKKNEFANLDSWLF